MDKNFIAQGVATRLNASENAIDAAIVQSSELLTEMLNARSNLGFAATVGNGATSKVAEAISVLAQARTALVEAHAELAEVQAKSGLRVTRMGLKPWDDGVPQAVQYRSAG